MTDQDWDGGFAKSLAVFFNGDALLDVDERGLPVRDDSFLLLFNAHDQPLTFTLPHKGFSPQGEPWTLVMTTDDADSAGGTTDGGATIDTPPRSVTILSEGARALAPWGRCESRRPHRAIRRRCYDSVGLHRFVTSLSPEDHRVPMQSGHVRDVTVHTH